MRAIAARRPRFRRAALAGLWAAAVALAAVALAPGLLLAPLPPAPAIAAPRGPPPAGTVVFDELVAGERAGSGFLLQLPGGALIGVTTAHSLAGRAAQPVRFALPGESAFVAEFGLPYLARGVPHGSGEPPAELRADLVLLRPEAALDPGRALLADERGGPQPGERVWLYAGRAGGTSGQRPLAGTVESATPDGAWVRLDEWHDLGGASGSPVISEHTGRVVGMAVAISPRPGALLLGLSPISAILAAAGAAP
jgi:hypothetical protein